MNEAGSGLGAAVANGKIYAIGGAKEGGKTGTNEEYAPATDTWALKTPIPTPRDYFATAVHQNKIYCIGGIIESARYKLYSQLIEHAKSKGFDVNKIIITL